MQDLNFFFNLVISRRCFVGGVKQICQKKTKARVEIIHIFFSLNTQISDFFLVVTIVFLLQTFTKQDSWKTQDGAHRWTKKCQARQCIPVLARHFFVILPCGVFQLSCCVRSLTRTTTVQKCTTLA